MRIIGKNIPDNKCIYISLTYIYGIGKSLSLKICNKLNIYLYKKVCDLDENEINLIRKELSNYIIEGELIRNNSFNIKKLIDIGTYRGFRHKKKLPCRGQRTRTNSKTCKKKKNKIF
ncbi:30S ribosomal protein S13 [Candidatus Nardonella dryophthoridicola]|uniref:Small ribosomal subunit protein uS13 n=1 Tax=endosymbiont of Rhynchophorus ferrugineus TaxID=1972133 RepID=A0A2Z5TIP9_9GAMM|nr:30S ribosomal protein S13 [Candidatus Nardonella dryophthoridicola]QTJ62866.1 30S ribosomal protein S13 [Candidatus Nardonella dryophthoridicola]BBA85112.1 30S ribosomal protein S13 [endosymbiont of Rhynchophorus ferrugineus]